MLTYRPRSVSSLLIRFNAIVKAVCGDGVFYVVHAILHEMRGLLYTVSDRTESKSIAIKKKKK